MRGVRLGKFHGTYIKLPFHLATSYARVRRFRLLSERNGLAMEVYLRKGQLFIAFAVAIAWGLLAAERPATAGEVTVVQSHAACKDTATVERFEEFERRDDDQGYKQLYLSTGASRECIFLRSNEILTAGEVRGEWACVKSSQSSPCYWTRASILSRR
jgi:hypothetical protein